MKHDDGSHDRRAAPAHRQPMFGLERCALVGMVHLEALPGSAGWQGSMQRVLESAERDVERLVAGGCDAVIVENMHDVPYLRARVEPETVAAMALAVARCTRHGVPVGVQVLAAANRQALGVAVAAGASFVRVEAYAYGHVADEGWLEATAAELARARAALGATDRIAFWADIKKKHAAHAATGDLSLAEIARGTAFCGADVLIVTGQETGWPTRPEDVDAARAGGLPVAVGSGVDATNVETMARHADALIVGTALKTDGVWRNPVEVERVEALANLVRGR